MTEPTDDDGFRTVHATADDNMERRGPAWSETLGRDRTPEELAERRSALAACDYDPEQIRQEFYPDAQPTPEYVSQDRTHAGCILCDGSGMKTIMIGESTARLPCNGPLFYTHEECPGCREGQTSDPRAHISSCSNVNPQRYEKGWKDPRTYKQMTAEELVVYHAQNLDRPDALRRLDFLTRSPELVDSYCERFKPEPQAPERYDPQYQSPWDAPTYTALDSPTQRAVNAAMPARLRAMAEAVGQTQGLMDRARARMDRRVSKVFRIWDWPRTTVTDTVPAYTRGTRDRGWGLLHDQIWFYDEPPAHINEHVQYDLLLLVFGGGGDTVPFQYDGKWWRRDAGRWLRLYMDRKMLWLPRWVSRLRMWNRFRLHEFHSGDDDSAPHDHPWGFLTFPFGTYTETVEIAVADLTAWERYRYVKLEDITSPQSGYLRITRAVRRWRFHWRNALHRHFVHEPARPFRTFVMAREAVPERRWGFWPKPDTFVPFDEWTEYTK